MEEKNSLIVSNSHLRIGNLRFTLNGGICHDVGIGNTMRYEFG
jgi:hypothetical protein